MPFSPRIWKKYGRDDRGRRQPDSDTELDRRHDSGNQTSNHQPPRRAISMLFAEGS